MAASPRSSRSDLFLCGAAPSPSWRRWAPSMVAPPPRGRSRRPQAGRRATGALKGRSQNRSLRLHRTQRPRPYRRQRQHRPCQTVARDVETQPRRPQGQALPPRTPPPGRHHLRRGVRARAQPHRSRFCANWSGAEPPAWPLAPPMPAPRAALAVEFQRHRKTLRRALCPARRLAAHRSRRVRRAGRRQWLRQDHAAEDRRACWCARPRAACAFQECQRRAIPSTIPSP